MPMLALPRIFTTRGCSVEIEDRWATEKSDHVASGEEARDQGRRCDDLGSVEQTDTVLPGLITRPIPARPRLPGQVTDGPDEKKPGCWHGFRKPDALPAPLLKIPTTAHWSVEEAGMRKSGAVVAAPRKPLLKLPV